MVFVIIVLIIISSVTIIFIITITIIFAMLLSLLPVIFTLTHLLCYKCMTIKRLLNTLHVSSLGKTF